MWKKVLIATDGSPNAAAAIEALAMRRWPSETQFMIVTVSDESVGGKTSPAKAAETAATAAQALQAKVAGAKAEIKTPSGKPGPEIVRTAREWGADYIAVGGYSRRGLSKLILGSVADAVLKNSECALLIGKPSPGGSHPQKAIVCISDQGLTDQTISGLTATSWREDVEFIVANAFLAPVAYYSPNPSMDTALFAEAKDATRTKAKEIVQTAVQSVQEKLAAHKVSGQEIEGINVADEVVQLSERTGADLLILGPRLHTGIDEWLEGSVTSDSLSKAHCSVELLRA